MQSQIEGFTVVADLRWRAWGGIAADVWDVRCEPSARGVYVSPDPRLFIPLLLEGGSFLIRETGGELEYDHDAPFTISYIPSNHPIEGRARGISRLKHLDLHLSDLSLRRRFGRALRRENLVEPRFGLEDERIAALARLIVDALESDLPSHDLYLDGLTNAMLALLFDIRPDSAKRRPALLRAQLRTVMDYIDERCVSTIRLAELASLVAMSETSFSHAFKAATGVPPHRWVMQSRIRKAQDMLRETTLPVSAVAVECGFADQAHFNRVFRSVMGTTPAIWKREQRH